MSIPKYEDIMLPLLELLRDGNEHSFRDAVEALASHFKLTPDERQQLLPSGVQPIFDNRVGWARTYLKKAGVIETPRRGIMRITERGRELLGEHLERIDNKVLMRYPEFQEFRSRMSTQSPSSQYQSDETATPEEQIGKLNELFRQNLADELLEKIAQCSPQFFERLVGRLFVAMGYEAAPKMQCVWSDAVATRASMSSSTKIGWG
jgi:restriction system protein